MDNEQNQAMPSPRVRKAAKSHEGQDTPSLCWMAKGGNMAPQGPLGCDTSSSGPSTSRGLYWSKEIKEESLGRADYEGTSCATCSETHSRFGQQILTTENRPGRASLFFSDDGTIFFSFEGINKRVL